MEKKKKENPRLQIFSMVWLWAFIVLLLLQQPGDFYALQSARIQDSRSKDTAM